MQSIDKSVWIAPGAQLYGKLSIAQDSSVWPFAVIRAECHEVRIGRMTNIQDFVMIHIGYGNPTLIGDSCSIAHHVTIHGAIVEDDCLIGINATIMDGAVIGRGSIVAGGAFVKEGSVFPACAVIAGIPAKVLRINDCTKENRLNAWKYHHNAEAYRQGSHRSWDGPEYDAWLVGKVAELEAQFADHPDSED